MADGFARRKMQPATNLEHHNFTLSHSSGTETIEGEATLSAVAFDKVVKAHSSRDLHVKNKPRRRKGKSITACFHR